MLMKTSIPTQCTTTALRKHGNLFESVKQENAKISSSPIRRNVQIKLSKQNAAREIEDITTAWLQKSGLFDETSAAYIKKKTA
mmetsp:Transcript_99799/g.321771  ORF Transcript_99799/g.321771 Transcript_99799/m.321771 type:complete len:83 (+) Transcript_99799:1490-1738(+)